MAPDALAQVLRPLATMFPAERFPQLLAGLDAGDDAAVYRINDELALVATVDFITPIVDDPYQFGAIAASNSLSDVYAMGGRPMLALNVCGFPRCLPREIIAEILRGGAEKVAEAGAALVGGHTVDDEEPKYGLVALGFVRPDRVLRKAGAQPGDVLVLTKPLGVGIVTTASKADQAKGNDVDAAIESMLKLNATAAELLQRHEIHACTDITGFALLGHSCEMAEKSGVLLRIDVSMVPFLPGAREYADAWLFPGGSGRNRNAYGDRVQFSESIPEEMRQLLFTPETSGGLLAAAPRACLTDLKTAFSAAGEPLWEIGEVLKGTGVSVAAGTAHSPTL